LSVQLFLTKTLLSLAKNAKGAKRSRAILKIASQAPGLKIDKIRFTKICVYSRAILKIALQKSALRLCEKPFISDKV